MENRWRCFVVFKLKLLLCSRLLEVEMRWRTSEEIQMEEDGKAAVSGDEIENKWRCCFALFKLKLLLCSRLLEVEMSK